jgi:hypothetical protein
MKIILISMIKKDYIVIIILLIIIMVFASLIVLNLSHDDNSTSLYRETLANNSNDPGTVEVIRNIGNPDGEKIAYVVGVHPLEHLTHETLVKLLLNRSNLNYCYDLYIINVTEDVGYYGDGLDNYENPGRQNGQNLAYKYVYPEIADGNYKLAIDVHSNIGAYPFKTFVFSPVKEGLGVRYASEIADNCENITYYSPDSTTSGPYLTVPLNENGTPAFYFEEWSFASQDVKDMHILELIDAVDNLN